MRKINFLGLGFEVGQDKSGLVVSHKHFQNYFSMLEQFGIRIVDQGEVSHRDKVGSKIYSSCEFQNVCWSPYQEAYSRIQNLLTQSETLLNWGGDHSVGISTVGAFLSRYPDGNVLWVDAHADLNLPQFSPSGNLHGMPLSVLLNLFNIRSLHFPWIESHLSPQNLVYLGLRDLDPFEDNVIRDLKIKAYTGSEVRCRGMTAVAQEIFKKFKDRPLHISFDIDSVCPDIAPSTGVSVPNGLGINDLKILGRTLSKHRQIRSMDVVEINPEIGNAKEVLHTYGAALKFLLPLLNQGGIDDGTGGSYQTFNSAQMESNSQI